jgi:histidinol phosphatase-like enzyme (inositol monophosphatase family)
MVGLEPEMNFQRELDFARSVAMHAGEIAVGHQMRGITPEMKPDLTPVTIADRECEQFIAARIQEMFPDDGILGEEGTSKESRNGRRWIIDPIDGTRDFTRGMPLWSVLIALEQDGEPVVGVSNMAARREMYSAARGHGAWMNGHPIGVSSINTPARATALLDGWKSFRLYPFSENLLEWMEQFWTVRSFGGALNAALVASGYAEIWIEPKAKAWDLAPLKILLEEAGAVFRDLDGGSSIYAGNCVAYVPALAGTVQNLIAPEL